jgi:integral membrane protein
MSDYSAQTPLGRFRVIAVLEGISYLVLLGIAMPLKYLLDMPAFVKYTGWAHGVLFILYMVTLAHVMYVHKWSIGKGLLAVVASLLPFGPFIFDKKLLREE